MNQTVILYFRGTIAEKVAKAITIPADIYRIESNKDSIESIVEQLKDRQSTIIVGLGSYSGRDIEKLRIERLCNRKWRNSELSQYPVIDITTVLHETNLSKFTFAHGNSWCNFLSLLLINSPELREKYNFIHIPQSFQVERAAAEIDRQLVSFSKICA